MTVEDSFVSVFAYEGRHARKYFPWLREMLDRLEPVWHEVTHYHKGKPRETEWRIVRCTTDMVLVLSQIIYWNLPDAAGESRLRVEKEGEIWLAKSATEWAKECGIPIHAARDAIDRLELFGVIRVSTLHFRGHPTKHVILNKDLLMEMVGAYRSSLVEFVK
jgi:hypothetical protein